MEHWPKFEQYGVREVPLTQRCSCVSTMKGVTVLLVGLMVWAGVSAMGDEEVEATVVPVEGDVQARVVEVTRGSNFTAPMLRDKALVRTQLACVTGSGPCNGIGKYLKIVIMKAVLLCLAIFPLALAQFDSSLVNIYLQNRPLVRRQLSCVEDRGPCDGIGQYLKRAVVEVLSRDCRSCSPQQASFARRILEFIRVNYPSDYSIIYNRYRGATAG